MAMEDILVLLLLDAGIKSSDHYKSKLSPLRYKIRAWLLPYVERETPVLDKIQRSVRCNALDLYFAWLANLASHTFYVIMLPLPFWFGYARPTRDLVWVLGFGIYLLGCLKDFFCLPRPRLPPLHRITMSGYTAQEYGFPSSHSANATAVTLVLLGYYLESGKDLLSPLANIAVLGFILLYYTSLIFGRVYCGMHGFLDILIGSLIGVGCTVGRNLIYPYWDSLLLDPYDMKPWLPIACVLFILACVHFHAQPVDDCPCFDDSVAFLGVLMGLELSHYIDAKTGRPLSIHYLWAESGLWKSFLRIVIGVSLVVVWKSVSKKLFLKLLTPLYAHLGVHIPRRFVQPVSESTESYNAIYQSSIRRLDEDEVADVPNFVKSIARKPKVEDTQGDNPPQSEEDVKAQTCGALKPRYDVEIVVRLIVYAGIPFMASFVYRRVMEVLEW